MRTVGSRESILTRKGVKKFMIKTRKIAATLAATAMMFQVLVVPAHAISLEISGNGSQSDSTVQLNAQQNTTVVQNNDFSATNNISAKASTGNNSADRNTGGDVEVSTGNATTYVGVANAGNSNEAHVDCCPSALGVDVLIRGNGSKSDNDVKLNNTNNVGVFQTNNSKIVNNINNDANTGRNSADRNTGGNVEVSTGNAKAYTSIFNGGNHNSAVVAGGQGSAGGVSAMILGNGESSDNDIRLGLNHGVLLVQNNSARIVNRVDTDANTGRNSADRNTGGDVEVSTGNAYAEVLVDNMVNFNFADVDCGCLMDVTAKIAGNGSESDNTIKARISDDLEVFQDNSCGSRYGRIGIYSLLGRKAPYGGKDCLVNNIYADADTGRNSAGRNTGGADSDPVVDTGDAGVLVEVENAGNSNVFGEAHGFSYPTSGVNLNITFSLSTLLGLLGLA